MGFNEVTAAPGGDVVTHIFCVFGIRLACYFDKKIQDVPRIGIGPDSGFLHFIGK